MKIDLNLAYGRMLEYWYHSDDGWKADGMEWYEREHTWCETQADRFGLPTKLVCAVTAALSPNCSWEVNKKSLVNLLTYGETATVGTYNVNKMKALRLLNGSSIDTELNKPTSPKTWHFYNDLYNPTNDKFVTNDRHQATIFGVEDATQIKGKAYAEMVTVTQECAKMVKYKGRKVLPMQMQAVTWNECRLRKGLV